MLLQYCRGFLAVFFFVIILFDSVYSFAATEADVIQGATLVKGNDCFQCHRIPTKLIGPSYKDVANKYKGADDAKVTELAQKVIKGGSGVWSTTPMRAHPMLSESDAKKMVLWILSLSDANASIPTTMVDSFAWYDWRRYVF